MKKIISVTLILTLMLSVICTFSVNAEESSETFSSGDYEYQLLADGTIAITRYTGNDDKIIVKSEIDGYTVSQIRYKAFFASDATELILPDTLTYIGNYAFQVMRNIKSIVIPEGVTYIGQGAFEHCKSLEEIILPNSVEHIGHSAFGSTAYYKDSDNWENGILYIGNHLIDSEKNLSGICKIKDGTTLIAELALCNLTDVTEFILPKSLKYICISSFNGCKNIKSINIPESVVSIEEYAFAYCNSLENINIPLSLTNLGLSIVEDTAFFNTSDNWQDDVLYINNALVSVKEEINGEYIIKDDTYIIADGAFNGCSSLKSVIMPDSVRVLGDKVFGWCYDLEKIILSESITEIPDGTFINCISLNQLVIPESITAIGEHAFFDCWSLDNITIPDSVTSIDNFAFFDIENNAFWDLKISGNPNSYAQKYATEMNIPFEETSEKYKETILPLLGLTESDYFYVEYEHHATNDEATNDEANESTPDFVLISAYNSWDADTAVTKYFGAYILHSNLRIYPSGDFAYFIYLPETNKIYTIDDAFKNNVPDIYDIFTQGIIGELIGDANNDNILNIKDATTIQKSLVGDGEIAYYYKRSGFTELFADFNRDGKLNIRDATAIQKFLAGITE